ncbi:hypothetical protein OQA88_4628 [Cercophora sp. LCS_1]
MHLQTLLPLALAASTSALPNVQPRNAHPKSAYNPPGAPGSDACKADTCCIWGHITNEMIVAFSDGPRCSSLARGAIRLGFHDAAAWNSSLPYGGADGSILLNPEELPRFENRGLEAIAGQTRAWFDAYKQYGISMADLIQVGANVAVAVCPQGPHIKTLVGRKDSAELPPPGLLPTPKQDAPTLIGLFAAKTFSADDLVALTGAHTVSRQFNVEPEKAGAPQDSTPGEWDNKYYAETAAQSAPRGIVRFPSDVSLATDAATAGKWQQFAARDGQRAWGGHYADAAFRMTLLGVKNVGELVDCSGILPVRR